MSYSETRMLCGVFRRGPYFWWSFFFLLFFIFSWKDGVMYGSSFITSSGVPPFFCALWFWRRGCCVVFSLSVFFAFCLFIISCLPVGDCFFFCGRYGEDGRFTGYGMMGDCLIIFGVTGLVMGQFCWLWGNKLVFFCSPFWFGLCLFDCFVLIVISIANSITNCELRTTIEYGF